MTISSYNSQKITILNLVLILLVLYIHNYYSEAADYPIAMGVQQFWGTNGIARVAVPLFFLLSGMLFFNGAQYVRECLPKMKKRVRALLIPYLLWNLLFVLFFVLLQILPGIGGLVNTDYVGQVFGHGTLNAVIQLFYVPVGFHLWFLRDLIIMVTLTPVLFLLLKSLKWLAPALVAISMYALLQVHFFDFIDYEMYCLFGIVYFTLGGAISSFASLEQLDQWLSKQVVAIAAVIFFSNAFWQVFGSDFNVWYNFLTALAGCIVVWRGYDWVSSFKLLNIEPLKSYLGYSFFIYLFHEPALNIIKKIGLKLFGVHEWSLILLYIIIPPIMCVITISIAKIIKRFMPRSYSVLVGGR